MEERRRREREEEKKRRTLHLVAWLPHLQQKD